MTAENVGQTAGLSIAGFTPWGMGRSNRERNFYIALACAAILHASFFVSAVRNGSAQRLGAENGAEDAISVSLVTEKDLESKATVVDNVSPPPGPIAPTQDKQQAKPQPQQPPQEQQPPTPPQPEEAKQQPPEPAQPPPEPQAQDTPQPDTQPDLPQETDPVKPQEQTAKAEDTSPDSKAQDLFSLQDDDPSKLQSDTAPKPEQKLKPETKRDTKKPSTSKSAKKSSPSKAQKKMAALDLSTQSLAPSLSGGGGEAAFQRPPGITRSGLNDKFARDVIRALQQTMPQLTDTLGRVTVRIFLSESGNVVEVRLVAGSKQPTLNQDVVFAARQTSYPIPPAGSNEADRTFIVTYIYD